MADRPRYLRERAPQGGKIGYDPKLHSPDALANDCAPARIAAGATLVPVSPQPDRRHVG